MGFQEWDELDGSIVLQHHPFFAAQAVPTYSNQERNCTIISYQEFEKSEKNEMSLVKLHWLQGKLVL